MDDTPLAVLQDGEAYYVDSDQIRAPRTLTDRHRHVVWRWEGRPFGDSQPELTPSVHDQNTTFSLRFPGQYFDNETRMNYNYYRDYNPVDGRYVESDPIGLATGLNAYAYAVSTPTIRIDPYGLTTWVCKRPIGGKPGTKGGLVMHHEYACITGKNGKIVCNSTTAGGGSISDFLYSKGRPTSPKDDYYDKNSCTEIDDNSSNCEEKCIAQKWSKPRPPYGIGPQGTDCEEYTDDVVQGCIRECFNKKRPN